MTHRMFGLALLAVLTSSSALAQDNEASTAALPSSVRQERKLIEAPDDSAERLKTAEAYVLEAQDSPSKLDSALEHVNAVLEAHPKNAKALLLAGRIEILRGNPLMALQRYQAAVKADPNNAFAHLALGDVYGRLKDEARATASFNEYRRLTGLAPAPPVKQESAAPRK